MTARAVGLAAAILFATAGEASAHSVFGITGFVGGLLHPLFVPIDALTIAALALLIGQQQAWRLGAPIAYVIGVVAGLAAIAAAYVPDFAEQALLALAVVAGLFGAAGRPLPLLVGVAVAAATGFVIGLDSPPEAISVAEANVTLLGTALGATVFLVLVAGIPARLGRDWQRLGLRIAGSWIAASAIIVLALQFARS